MSQLPRMDLFIFSSLCLQCSTVVTQNGCVREREFLAEYGSVRERISRGIPSRNSLSRTHPFCVTGVCARI